MAAENGNDHHQIEENPDISIQRETFLFHHDSSSMGDGSKLEDHYKLGKKVSQGGFSDIFLCTLLRDPKVKRAAKRMSKKRVPAENFAREISALRKIDHPNVLRLFESYEDDNYFYIVTELSTSGDLFDFLNSASNQDLTEIQLKRLVRQILICVNHCHAIGVIHSDLKPENILLGKGDAMASFEQLTLCDFGFAQFYNDESRMNHCIGTPEFVAPEVYRRNYGPKCDVWSCGVLAFLLLAGELPFNGNTPQVIYNQIKHRTDHFDLERWQNISAEGKSFVEGLLAKDEHNRPTAQEALEDPWFNTSCLEPVAVKGDSANYTTSHGSTTTTTTLASWNHNLIQFSAQQKLKQATYAFLVAHLTFQSRKKVVDEIFRKVDTNSDGLICRKEIEASFRAAAAAAAGANGTTSDLLLSEDDDELDDIFVRVDMDGNGFINYWEFLAATSSSSTLLCTENLKVAFDMFDKDKSNSITSENLRSIFRGHNTTKSRAQDGDDEDNNEEIPLVDESVMDAIIQQVDENGDGKISYEEFTNMMQENAKLSSNNKRPHHSLEEA